MPLAATPPWSPNDRDPFAVDPALGVLTAQELRNLIRDLMPQLNHRVHGRVIDKVIDRAARSARGFTPSPPSPQRVAAIEAFAHQVTHAQQPALPGRVDDCLRQATHAFLARDYPAALRIFRAWLIPLSDSEIDLGPPERVNQVLSVNLSTCAKQYLVSAYMTAAPNHRAQAVIDTINALPSISYWGRPLADLERVAIEPLPAFGAFLVQWRALVGKQAAAAEQRDWDRREDQWLREVIARTEGPAGLATLARRTRRFFDLVAWCRALATAGDWQAAREATRQAATLTPDKGCERPCFLDGMALAAQAQGANNLDQVLGQVWRQAPSFWRLVRWLGQCQTRQALVARSAAALQTAPTHASRQRALLHLLSGSFKPAARLLTVAKGVGWSRADHPGHLVFPVLARLVGAGEMAVHIPRVPNSMAHEALHHGLPTLHTPKVNDLLRLARLPSSTHSSERAVLVAAMRKAANKRIAGVTMNRLRHRYPHAAQLAVVGAKALGSEQGTTWLSELRVTYRRYPAFILALKEAGA